MAIQLEQARKEVRNLPLLPLRGVLVFPYMVTPLDVGREKSVAALEEAMVNDRLIFLTAQREGSIEDPREEDLYSVGTLCEVKQLLRMPEGQFRILVEGVKRGRIRRMLQDEPYFSVEVEELEERDLDGPQVEALARAAYNRFEDYVKLNKRLPSEVLVSLLNIEEPNRLADTIAAQLALSLSERQGLLENLSVKERLSQICVLITKELEILKLEKKIHLQVKEQMDKAQKEYYLREQMKVIQKELGEGEDQQAEVEQLRERIEEAGMPEEAYEKALHELRRLEKMPPMAAEAVVVRNYLDWLIELPWNIKTEDRLNLDVAQEILDEDHYGLDKVKELILEYLAVRQLAGNHRGSILCLVGPPGVGKTSLAQSVARALNRKFIRFSLGGVRDEAEIRGHRRTYIGAMPGKIIQSLRKVKSANAVILLDEIDKMSADFRGDPASALLEALDPEQNHQFGDHYLEVPFDLSDIFFITTANYLPAIPQPLQDRMEIIHIPGYTEDEKLEIAKHYLLPRQLERHGLIGRRVSITTDALERIILEYTKEAGVRELERQIGVVCRKVARQILQGEKKGARVTVKGLPNYLGAPKHRASIFDGIDRVGVVTGLAYTQVGGDTLDVEVTVVSGKGRLHLTGKLGEVMQESAQAAVSYVRSRAVELGIDEDFYEKNDIHIHVPEGAVPKDGPSAGITITTALVSALTQRPVMGRVTMTGEITLRGRVLPIGGLKEKLLAARRAGMEKVILPRENAGDLEEVPDNIKAALEICLVDHMDQVLKLALRDEPLGGREGEEGQEYLAPPHDRKTPWVEDGHVQSSSIRHQRS
ncbi:MAG: endopeptidase La [Limnochordia bacterium]|jgi:ATP-dependent Lon protease